MSVLPVSFAFYSFGFFRLFPLSALEDLHLELLYEDAKQRGGNLQTNKKYESSKRAKNCVFRGHEPSLPIPLLMAKA